MSEVHEDQHQRPPSPCTAPDWQVETGLVPYEEAVRRMEERARLIAERRAHELVWLLEHPPLYTAGTGTRAGDLIDANRFPVHVTGRGGRITYHGPGQRVAYTLLDVKQRFRGEVRTFVSALETWVIRTLARFDVEGLTHRDRVGVWVRRPWGPGPDEAKIAAIGLRIRHGISFHGISLNVAPDLSHYGAIVPCGLADSAVTSLNDLGRAVAMKDVDKALEEEFVRLIGPVRAVT